MGHEDQRERTDKIIEDTSRHKAEEIFDNVPPDKWKQNLLDRLWDSDYTDDGAVIRAGEILNGIEEVTDRDVFIEKVLVAMRPILDHIREDPIGYQQELQEAALSEEKIRINELFHYHVDNSGNMHLHVFPNIFTDNREKLRLMREGLRLTAEILNSDPSIKTVYGTSWIVAEKPELMEMLGFEVHGKVSKLEQKKKFQGEEREVWKASISREDFISKHL